jgi:hypothetical protein
MKRAESKPPEGRDQTPTTFSEILQHLLWLEPRATAAVLVDGEGETVDYATSLSSYDTKVAAANLRIVLEDITVCWSKVAPDDPLTHILVRARQGTFFVRPIADGYALVLVLRRRNFAVSSRGVAWATRLLSKEAGWSAVSEEVLAWHPAEVELHATKRFRPSQIKINDTWERVEVLGSIVGLGREKGFRCRLQSGAEITLLREPTGIWFADQPAQGLSSHHGPDDTRPPSRFPG